MATIVVLSATILTKIAAGRLTTFRSFYAGVHGVGATPDPIPNSAVKPHCGYNTGALGSGKIAKRQHKNYEPKTARKGGFCFFYERCITGEKEFL